MENNEILEKIREASLQSNSITKNKILNQNNGEYSINVNLFYEWINILEDILTLENDFILRNELDEIIRQSRSFDNSIFESQFLEVLNNFRKFSSNYT